MGEIREASPEDAAEIATLLRASVTQLCIGDHENDADRLGEWLVNKTPHDVLKWIGAEHLRLVVADEKPGIQAVGMASEKGVIHLLYVHPRARFKGYSDAILSTLETILADQGHKTIRLESTHTARDFYLARGYVENGETCRSPCLSMEKQLAGRDKGFSRPESLDDPARQP